MNQIQVDLPYPRASGNHATKHTTTGAHYKTQASKVYDALVLTRLDRMGLAGRKLAGPLDVTYVLCAPSRRAVDSDNVLKPLKDALTKARFWTDDSNAVIRSEAIEWGDVVPGGQVWLRVRYTP